MEDVWPEARVRVIIARGRVRIVMNRNAVGLPSNRILSDEAFAKLTDEFLFDTMPMTVQEFLAAGESSEEMIDRWSETVLKELRDGIPALNVRYDGGTHVLWNTDGGADARSEVARFLITARTQPKILEEKFQKWVKDGRNPATDPLA
jgi:hypothetical protein